MQNLELSRMMEHVKSSTPRRKTIKNSEREAYVDQAFHGCVQQKDHAVQIDNSKKSCRLKPKENDCASNLEIRDLLEYDQSWARRTDRVEKSWLRPDTHEPSAKNKMLI